MTAGIFITETEPGPGIRLAVKDLFDTAGIRTTYGSAVFAEHVPETTAAAVRLLEEAGYASVGKANLHEFAYGVTSENPHFGTVPNPRYPGRVAGGSSGGSAAALAAGLAEAALGTDTGGSVRIPSACCGTTGLKTTWGLVPVEGCFPLAPSYDSVGPMAQDVAGCARMMTALVPGFRTREPPPLGELRAGVAWIEQADPLVRGPVESVAALFGEARAVELPDEPVTQALLMREVAEVHERLFAENADRYGPDVRQKIARCLEVTDREAAAAARERERLRERALALVDGLDVLLTPTLPGLPPRAGGYDDDNDPGARLVRFTAPVNALGWPALALPCGDAGNGLPVSAQLVGRPGDDAWLLAVGAAVEASFA